MAKIEVAVLNIATYNGPGTPLEVRLYCSQSFTNANGDVVPAGTLDSNSWYKRASVTNAGGILTAGAFTGTNAVDSTVNNSYDNGSTYTLVLYDSQGSRLAILYSELRVYDSTPSPTTWAGLANVSQTVFQPQRKDYPTWEQLWGYLTSSVGAYYSRTQSDALFVHLVGAETIAGSKIFSSSPTVPDPTTALQAANKEYVDTTAAAAAKFPSNSELLTFTPPSDDATTLTAINALLKYLKENRVLGGRPVTDAAPVPPTIANLSVRYALEDLTDSGGAGLNLTDHNSVTFGPGQKGNAAIFNGTTQFLDRASNAVLVMGNTQSFSVNIWFNLTDKAGVRTFLSKGDATQEYAVYYNDGDDKLYFNIYNVALGNSTATIAAPAAGSWHMVSAVYDNAALQLRISLDGGAPVTVSSTHGAQTGTDNLMIGKFTTSLPVLMKGKLDEITIYKHALTAGEITSLYNWGIGTSGTGATFVPDDLLNNVHSANKTDYYETSPFSVARFRTIATSVDVLVWSNIFSTTPNYAPCVVLVNGAFQAAITPVADGNLMTTIALPAGDKIVEIVGGLQSKTGFGSPNIIGTFLKGAYFNNKAYFEADARTGTLFIYGDSNSVGCDTTRPSTDAWPMLLRSSRAERVVVEGYGFRALVNDAANSTLIATFVAAMLLCRPSIVLLNIGTNDFQLNTTLADFNTMYGALLDAIHATAPSARIIAVTPLVWSSEASVNGIGVTMAQYRSTIATVQSTRSTFVELVDGTTLATTGQMSTGFHFTTAGHVSIAAGINAVLG